MRESTRSGAVPALAAIGSLMAAMSCCLPVGTILFATGLAGASAWLQTLRPYLMAGSVAAVGFGFWRMYRASHCERRSPLSVGLLWTSAVLLCAFLFFPQEMAGLVADLMPAGDR